MESEPDRPLTETEWKVMRIVWRLKRGAARDIYRAAGADYDMHPSAVKTLLRRLVEKGHLKTTQVGNCYVYRPARSRLRTLCAIAERLLEHVDEGAGRVLAHMLKKSKVSAAEIAELRAILDARDSEDGEDGQ